VDGANHGSGSVGLKLAPNQDKTAQDHSKKNCLLEDCLSLLGKGRMGDGWAIKVAREFDTKLLPTYKIIVLYRWQS
jgi:hypothetical protein